MKSVKIIVALTFISALAVTANAQEVKTLYAQPYSQAAFYEALQKTAVQAQQMSQAPKQKTQNTKKVLDIDAELRKSVVFIERAGKYNNVLNLSHPWNSESIGNGTGFVIKNPVGDGYMIMTAKHVVSNNISGLTLTRADNQDIQISTDDGTVSVDDNDTGIIELGDDLALISVKDANFFKGMKPLSFALNEPKRLDPLYVVSFPKSSDEERAIPGVFEGYDRSKVDKNDKEVLYYARMMTISNMLTGGSSGAAVVNANKEVVGVYVAGDDQTSHLALPLDRIQRFLEQVKEHKTPQTAVIGTNDFKIDKTAKTKYPDLSCTLQPVQIKIGSFLEQCGIDESCRIFSIDKFHVNARGLLSDSAGRSMYVEDYLAAKKPDDYISVGFCRNDSIFVAEGPLQGIKNIDKHRDPGVIKPEDLKNLGSVIIIEDSYPDAQGQEYYTNLRVIASNINLQCVYNSIIYQVNGTKVKSIAELNAALNPNPGGDNYFETGTNGYCKFIVKTI